MNSYNLDGNETSLYKEGDFVVRFHGCEMSIERNCEKEAESHLRQWRTNFHAGR